MLKFGIIAEGPTDQQVIQNILLGYFEQLEEEPVVDFIQPPRAVPGDPPPGGWTLVFKSLARNDHEEALRYHDYLVIHIDTDMQEEHGFDVPRQEAGNTLSVSHTVARVSEKIKSNIDPAFLQGNMHRILFAVAVDEIECWLLPLLYKNKKKAGKITGCLKAANLELGKRGNKSLSAGKKKSVAAYDMVSSGYLKRKTLIELRSFNPSLDLFIDQLDDIDRGLAKENPTGSQEQN